MADLGQISPGPSIHQQEKKKLVVSQADLEQRYKDILRKQTVSRMFRMRPFYVLLLLSFVMVILFRYVPIYGLIIAFKNFNIVDGILGSPWNNFKHFKQLVNDPFFFRCFFNTFWITTLRLIFAFPCPIILALLLNEVRFTPLKKITQTISYLPHFISWVIISGILKEILSPQRGIVAYFYELAGLEPVNWLTNVPTFRGLLVVTGIWQSVGWGTIIYLAALSSIDPGLYESAGIDGANRFQNAIYITIPSLVPMITILFLIRVGHLMSEAFGQIFNLYNPLVYKVSDVFETYIYRAGLRDGRYAYTTAVGLFKNVVGVIILIGANSIVKRFSEYAIW